MRLWIDDLREDPDTKHGRYSETVGWRWVKTSDAAIAALAMWEQSSGRHYFDDVLDEVAFDHDLGGDDTTRRVMLWMIEQDVWPKCISVHTANPVGREWLIGMAKRYAPAGTVIAG